MNKMLYDDYICLMVFRAGHPVGYLKRSGAAAAAIRQKKQRRCAYRYSNKKVVPLPLLACKTAAAAACQCR